jgi:hypothetical protein
MKIFQNKRQCLHVASHLRNGNPVCYAHFKARKVECVENTSWPTLSGAEPEQIAELRGRIVRAREQRKRELVAVRKLKSKSRRKA